MITLEEIEYLDSYIKEHCDDNPGLLSLTESVCAAARRGVEADDVTTHLERENAALRHDIERSTQRNSDLLAEVEALREAADEYALGDERYEYVRRLNAAQFAELYRRNIAENVPFDDLVDAAALRDAGVSP
jgi:hypothetical protein